MAASAATSSSHASLSFVDLTQSDDEDDVQRRVPRKRASAAAHLSWDIPTSHDGFPMVNNLDSALGQRPLARDPKFSKNAVWSQAAENTRTLANSGHKIPPFLPMGGNNKNSNRTSTRMPTPRADISTAERTYGANTSKRRKTNGAMLSNGALNSKVSDFDAPLLEHTSQQSTVPSVIIPAGKESGGQTSSQSLPTNSRISREGRIQKPRYQSNGDVRVLAEERRDRMVQVLRDQVFKHIKAAIKKYETVLSSEDRTEIGTKTAGNLVEDLSFAENFTANNWKLSSDYESRLSVRAQSYVDKHAKQILEANNNASHKSSKGIVRTKSARPESHLLDEDPRVSSESGGSTLPITAISAFRTRLPRPSSQAQASDTPSSPPETNAPHGILQRIKNDARTSDAISRESSYELRSSRRSTRPSIHQSQTIGSPEPQGHSSNAKLETVVRYGDRSCSAARVGGIQWSNPERYRSEFPRPYTSEADLENVTKAVESTYVRNAYLRSRLGLDAEAIGSCVIHLGFCSNELELTCRLVTKFLRGRRHSSDDPKENIMSLMAGQESNVPKLALLLEQELKRPGKEPARLLLRARGIASLTSFLLDAARQSLAAKPQLVRLQATQQGHALPKSSISALLRGREIYGMTPSRVRRGLNTFETKASSHLEDSLVCRHEWIDCCGDISAVTWTSERAFICGATAHSDHHNMQYNKPGNLSVGSCSQATLRAFADHRIPRPISCPSNLPNAPDSVYQTQDPWLYTSVVATSHSDVTGYTFTASFDKTVKVWIVAEDGCSMDLQGTWVHDGMVNFVVTSEHHERVATASDVSADAIRVYNFDELDINGTPFDTYCGERAKEQALELRRRDTWAYFPATIQWGKAAGVKDFLLVGYSPRSVTGHDVDIPEEKRNSGELCLWNVNDGSRITISSAKSQNVFEVIWHPTQPCFLVATSPCGVFEPDTRTQIRLFAQNEFGTFIHIKAMDCPASDINEMTMMPNSSVQCYVTASCTDGNTYVWDTAQGDKPVHVLSHGDSLDNPLHDMPLELADTGVKFASWGRTIDRFYTGGSDGKVKAWNIRAARGRAFVRNVLEVTGGISAGAFSKDFSLLLVGDATGKVHLLGVDDSDLEEVAAQPSKVPGNTRPNLQKLGRLVMRRPKVIIPHPEPPPPDGHAMKLDEVEQTGQETAQAFLDSRQLILHPDRKVGVIQGPYYHETNLYRREAHSDGDGTQPLLLEWQARQQFEQDTSIEELELPRLPTVQSSTPGQHKKNMSLDFDFSKLSLSCHELLIRDRAEMDWDDCGFEYEMSPSWKIFGGRKRLS